MAEKIAYSYVPDRGWTGKGFSIPHAPVQPGEVRLTLHPFGRESREVPVTKVETAGECLEITAEEFDYRSGWILTVGGDSYTRRDMDEERCEGLEYFEAGQEGDLLYRLYSPQSASPRPLLLFLHGGGNGGTDNITHVAADYSCLQFAQRYPDFYILAPQAREADFKMMAGRIGKTDFAHSDMGGDFGWSRRYLGEVCDLIRGMIREGKVDRKRVYVTGMSMGGAGTLRAMSVGADLFAAAVPVCPTMTPETFAILKGLTRARLWIATSYVDHTIYRHKYIVDGILALRDAGNRDARLTLYSPEELRKYGIATDENLSYPELFSQNHMSWVPTYHDEHGIMSWLTEQVRED
jgi:predicted peptidase